MSCYYSLRTLSFGGGLNSTALLLYLYQEQVNIDLIMFADTGAEKPETYKHVEVFSKWCEQHGFPEITVVREERFTLEDELKAAHTLPSIVLGMRSCSDKFKIRPQNRFVATWKPAIEAWNRGERVLKYVGFDFSEQYRAKDYDNTLYIVQYPLIEAEIDRQGCIDLCKNHGLPIPIKSSCFFCPEMRANEIVWLRRKHPALLQRALDLEVNNTAMHSVEGLLRQMSWKQALVHIDAGNIHLIPKRAQRMNCTCMDGEFSE